MVGAEREKGKKAEGKKKGDRKLQRDRWMDGRIDGRREVRGSEEAGAFLPFLLTLVRLWQNPQTPVLPRRFLQSHPEANA